MSFYDLINNHVVLDDEERFTAIIGSVPSTTAKSPEIWNQVYRHLGDSCSMVALDVSSENLSQLMALLVENKNFLGGAVTTPYKEKVFKWLEGNVTAEVSKIGAVNCLFRRGSELIGTNTDGEAALHSFHEAFGMRSNRKILILGNGGAGKAVSTYFASIPENEIIIATRKHDDEEFAKTIGSKWIHTDMINIIIPSIHSIINCTSAGFGDQVNVSPLSKESILYCQSDIEVFDIIYNPLKTKLLSDFESRGEKKLLNGLRMNKLQAALAIRYCHSIEYSDIEKALGGE